MAHATVSCRSGILALLSDRGGALWIGTDGGGLSRFAEGKFSSYQTRDGLSNQIIRCLYEDNEGSVWLGTAGGGINRFREYRVTMRTMREGLPSDSVRSIQQDHSGDIWLGTTNGIARLRASGDLVVYGSKDGPSRDLMWPVIRDRHSNLWAGSEDGVLREFRGEPKGQPERCGGSSVPSACCLSNGMARCGPLRGTASSGFRASRWRSSARGRAWLPCR